MADGESNELCGKLSGLVANVPVDQFYKEFNLDDGHLFSEYYFNDMKRIFHMQGMDLWPKTLDTPDAKMIRLHFSLVCFMPPKFFPKRTKHGHLAGYAHDKSVFMMKDCFDQVDNHNSISMAMENYPTMAIFMSKVDGNDTTKKKRAQTNGNRKKRSILDTKNASCLAAVNYFRVGTSTQVLWLAMTREKTPEESIHVVW